jgi:phospholipase C
MARILSQIEHVVVVMFENRSFDTIFGWLDTNGAQQPTQYLPASPSPKPFDGLSRNLFNPQTAAYFNGQDQDKLWGPFDKATSTVNPNPDPLEDFTNVNYQLFGPEEPSQNPRCQTWDSWSTMLCKLAQISQSK